ncbi:hypothetical protein DPX16_23795 [Anabarilius grahami]|uniref:Uncharacterized protein n=1 Tax=Anabarilius grahami TaxID=495550 RepID=A0A3N0YNB2_ANAGA|nr:hypothetical protein DPX16_23795 [Anabarilius grahami]
MKAERREQMRIPDSTDIKTGILDLIFTPDSMRTERRGARATQRHSRRTGEHRGSWRHTGDSAADWAGDECQVRVISTLVRECDVIGWVQSLACL